MQSALARYLNPELLAQIAHRRIEPAGLVLGNLAGAHKSPLAGFAVEFAGHREYARGDDPRHIDWRLYFTRDKLFVKQYEMETNFVAHLVLDVSASMRYGEGDSQKLLYASRMAGTLAYAIIKQSDKASLALFDDAVRAFIPPSGSLAQIVRMTGEFDATKPVAKTRMADCLVDLAGRMTRRELVLIFSDFLTDLDELEPALQRLRYGRHEVVLFHVLHHDELSFEFAGQVRFRGLETDDQFLTQPNELRAAYLEEMARFTSRLDDLCYRNGIERVPVDTSRDMATVFTDYLTQRSLMARR